MDGPPWIPDPAPDTRPNCHQVIGRSKTRRTRYKFLVARFNCSWCSSYPIHVRKVTWTLSRACADWLHSVDCGFPLRSCSREEGLQEGKGSGRDLSESGRAPRIRYRSHRASQLLVPRPAWGRGQDVQCSAARKVDCAMWESLRFPQPSGALVHPARNSPQFT